MLFAKRGLTFGNADELDEVDASRFKLECPLSSRRSKQYVRHQAFAPRNHGPSQRN